MTGKRISIKLPHIQLSRRYWLLVSGVVIVGLLLAALLLWLKLHSGPIVTKEDGVTITSVSPQQLQALYTAPVKTVQSGNTAQAWARDGFLILDIRPRADYIKSHIKGAMSAPVDQLPSSQMITTDTIVLFSPHQTDIDKAKTILKDKGMTSLYVLRQSLAEIERDGYTLESSEL